MKISLDSYSYFSHNLVFFFLPEKNETNSFQRNFCGGGAIVNEVGIVNRVDARFERSPVDLMVFFHLLQWPTCILSILSIMA